MTYEEWLAEGTRRFGEDKLKWKFVCPICSNVAAVEDYYPFKDIGAQPDAATKECIGRYSGTPYRAFPGEGQKRGRPCDYAIYGLFRFPGVIVIQPDGKETMAFRFADEEDLKRVGKGETHDGSKATQ